MHKSGIVTAIHNDRAVVRLARHSACASCGACSHGGGDSSKDIVVEALNEPGAAVGDQVQVDLESVQVVRAAFIFYGIPLIALMAGVLAAKPIMTSAGFGDKAELLAALAGTLLMIGSFVAIRLNENRLKKSGRYLSRIVEVCEKEKE